MLRVFVVIIAAFAIMTPAVPLAAKDAARTALDQYLAEGSFSKAEYELIQQTARDPGDSQAYFELGILQFLSTVQDLVQKLYDYGPQDFTGFIPFLRLPVDDNPAPLRLDYTNARKIFDDLYAGLSRAEALLQKVESPGVKVPLHFGNIKLTVRANGMNLQQPLWALFNRVNRGSHITAKDADSYYIVFDKGDASWLRAYCHLLMALCDFLQAYDWGELFDRTGHLLFRNTATTYPFLVSGARPFEYNHVEMTDIIAFIHLVNFPLLDAGRMKSSLAHLEAMVNWSRQSWREILAEKDNDHEWIPNTNQTGMLPGMTVSGEIIESWLGFLDEAGDILAGRRLLPFWRLRYPEMEYMDRKDMEIYANSLQGINLRRVFLEPRAFDLVLWLQGTAAYPYLEKGPITRMEVWGRMARVFGGDLFSYAAWFN